MALRVALEQSDMVLSSLDLGTSHRGLPRTSCQYATTGCPQLGLEARYGLVELSQDLNL
jgi:hypothetical protein